jgi:hypothetical protein
LGVRWPGYARQMAIAYIEETFARYRANDREGASRCVWRALAYNPSWITNRGVAAVALKTTWARVANH